MPDPAKKEEPGDKGGEKNGDKGVSQADFKALTDIVKDMATGNAATNEAIAGLTQSVREGLKPAAPAKPVQQQQQTVDLESLNRTEYMEHIVGKIGSMLDDKLKPMGEQITTGRKESAQSKMALDLKETRAANPEFDEWKEELTDVAKSNPHASFGDLLILARGRHPVKAREMDEKHTVKPGDTGVGAKPFGGGKPGSSGDDEPVTDMSKEDAAEAAFQEVMGSLSMIDNSDTANPN